MARLLCLGAVAVGWLVGCGKSEKDVPVAEHEAAAAPAAEVAEAVPAPAPVTAPKPKATARTLALTPEMESAVVAVRVEVPGSIMREHSGVILGREVFAPPVAPETGRRYVAVLMPGFEEAGLRDKKCKLAVLRQRLDPNNNVYVMSRPAILATFDAASHVAVVQYKEDFAYRLEEGALEAMDAAEAVVTGATAAGETLWLLQGVVNQDQVKQAAALPRGYEGTGINALMDVSLLRAEMTAEGLRLAAGQTLGRGPLMNAQSRTNVAAVLAGDGRVLGFARPGAAPELRGFELLAVPDVTAKELRYEMEGVETVEAEAYSKSLGYFRVRVKGALKDPLQEFVYSRLALRNLAAPEEFTPAADLRASQPAMVHDGELKRCFVQEDGSFLLDLQMPPGAESAYQVVQLELLRVGEEVAFRTAPFLVMSKRRGAGMYHTLAGVPGAGEAVAGASVPAGGEPAVPPMPGATPATAPAADAAAAQSGAVEMTTESRILLGVSIGEGREVLFKLEGAPYWKRLSLAERKWLPLPVATEELSYCMLAGNKDAIFVLDPGRAELRRYHAGTLALEKTARLPGGMSYHSVAAGCLTDDGPVAVLGSRGAVACDARELTVKLTSNLAGERELLQSGKDVYLASGDGWAVWARELNGRGGFASLYSYKGVMSGFGMEAIGFPIRRMSVQPTVTRSAPSVEATPGNNSGMALTTSCNYYVVSNAQNGREGPRTPLRCNFYSYYADRPWATVDVPEAGDVPLGDWETFSQRVWLDPASLTFALWHAEKTMTLHTLDRAALPQPAVPVLLNYPDCHVSRAVGFHFKPLVLGGSGEVTVTDAPKGLTVGADGMLDWVPPEVMAGTHVSFFLRLAGSAPGQGAQVQVELNVDGRPPVAAVPASLTWNGAELAAAEAASGKVGVTVLPLNSRFYSSERPILEVVPGLNDYLGLMLKDRTLQLLSLKDWKVAGSRALGTNAAAYLAGDVVFIYNNITRELTRHSLPDFAVTHRLTLPAGPKLLGLAVGEKQSGPLTLVQQTMVKILTPNGLPAGEQVEYPVQILDKETLDPARWAAYKPRKEERKKGDYTPQRQIANFHHNNKELPLKLPSSTDGRLVCFPAGVIMISPGLTVDFFYPKGSMMYPYDLHAPTTTPTGDRLFADGRMLRGGMSEEIRVCDGKTATLSSCGDYVAWVKTENDGMDRRQIRLHSANDGRALLVLGGVELLKLHDGEEDYHRRLVCGQGDKNLLTVLSRGGFHLQCIDLDVAAAYKITDPQSAYVTSHPFPVLAEGRTLDYQVTVNNPAAVDRYELRDPPPGALITPQGHLSYHAPTRLKESQGEIISVVIYFKDGQVALHQFPVYVIALGKMTGGAIK